MANAHHAQAIRPCSRTILLTGTSPHDILGQSLANRFGSSLQLLDDITQAKTARLAIGVHDRAGDVRSFALWAIRTSTPALHITFQGQEALIGPLTQADVRGCGYCAWSRIAAANVYAKKTDASGPTIAATVATAISREISAILRGAHRSRLRHHVLVTNGRSKSLHSFIPLPYCPVCGGAAPASSTVPTSLIAAVDPGAVLAALSGWVDPRTGIVSRIIVEKPGDTGLDIPIVVTAAPPLLLEDSGEFRQLPIGWGKGLTLSRAILSAVGEAIERYAPSLPDPARIRWASVDELEEPYLDPRDCALYTDVQYSQDGFPYSRFDPNVRHPWVRGWWFGGDPVWVPAIMAFLSFTLWREHAICQGTSNGLAAANTIEDASLRAIMELVERDAFMHAWLTGRPGQRIVLKRESELQGIIEAIEALGASVEMYSLASACGTTVLCLALGDGIHYPGVTIGLGSDLDPQSAARQAILELGQTGPHLRRMMISGSYRIPHTAQDVKEMLDHAAYYFPSQRATAFGRLRTRASSINVDDLPVMDESSLSRAGLRIALVDVTSPDVAMGPFRVVRAVSPGLQPISYGYGLDRVPVAHIRKSGVSPDVPPVHPIW